MKIDVTFVPAEISEGVVGARSAVIIDVLRASTTMITALGNGAACVIPVAGIDEARAVARQRGGDALLCGERGGVRIPGFDLGNSPQEYRRETVAGRALAFTSTNGSRLFRLAGSAGAVYVGALLNATALAARLCGEGRDVALLCAGNEGRYTQDDVFCAGLLIDRVERSRGVDGDGSDAARAALRYYTEHRSDPLAVLQSCAHGRYLTGIGFGPDLVVCAGIDTSSVVPVYRDGAVVRG